MSMTWKAPPSRSANGTSGGTRCTPSSTTLMFSAMARSTTARTPTQTRIACSSNARSTGLDAGASPAGDLGSAPAPSAGLEARAVEAGQDRRREHHPHHLADGVGGVDLVDAQERRQLDRERRLAGAGGAAEVEHQRARQPTDAPHGAVARRGVAAFEALDVIGDAARQLGVAARSRTPSRSSSHWTSIAMR